MADSSFSGLSIGLAGVASILRMILSEFFLHRFASQQAIMTNTHQAFGLYMHQEPPDELFAMKLHRPVLVLPIKRLQLDSIL